MHKRIAQSERESWQIRVRIKQDLMKNLIFGFQSRLPTGIVLGFLGFRHDVIPIMQRLSHGTRAYIYHADGLKGFVDKFDAAHILQEQERRGKLKELTET